MEQSVGVRVPSLAPGPQSQPVPLSATDTPAPPAAEPLTSLKFYVDRGLIHRPGEEREPLLTFFDPELPYDTKYYRIILRKMIGNSMYVVYLLRRGAQKQAARSTLRLSTGKPKDGVNNETCCNIITHNINYTNITA